MSRTLPCLLAALVFSIATHASPQLAPAAIDRAILTGRANDFRTVAFGCIALRAAGSAIGGGLLDVAIQAARNSGQAAYLARFLGPAGRVAMASWDATRAGRPFAATDIMPVMLGTTTLSIRFEPLLPDRATSIAPVLPDAITGAAFHAQIGKELLLAQSSLTEGDQVIWKNAEGATVEYRPVTVEFNAEQVKKMYNSSGVNLVARTANGERTCVDVPMRTIRDVLNPQ